MHAHRQQCISSSIEQNSAVEFSKLTAYPDHSWQRRKHCSLRQASSRKALLQSMLRFHLALLQSMLRKMLHIFVSCLGTTIWRTRNRRHWTLLCSMARPRRSLKMYPIHQPMLQSTAQGMPSCTGLGKAHVGRFHVCKNPYPNTSHAVTQRSKAPRRFTKDTTRATLESHR